MGDRSLELATFIRASVSLHSEPDGRSMSATPSPLQGRPGEFFELDPAQAGRRLAAAVTRHSQLVWRALRRFGVPERDVPDAAQQVFLAFFQHCSEVEAGKEPSYLAAVAVKVAANARRKQQRSREDALGESALEAVAGANTPEELLHQKQLREELDRGLCSLPFEQRTVFVLYELEGFTLPEIAEALDTPLGTATSRLRRARAGFEAWVDGRAGEKT